MSEDDEVTVLIGSAGRRLYLVDWFEAAFERLGVSGTVHVTDADPHSAAYIGSKHRHRMPRYTEPTYASEMESLFDELRPDLFFSVNDFELAALSVDGLGERLERFGGIVLSLSAERHAAVHDKYAMFHELRSIGVNTPDTALLADRDGVNRISRSHSQLVIKDRFGSGSSGLIRVEGEELESAIVWATRSSAMRTPAELIVQPVIDGEEYGVDIVRPLIFVEETTPRILARRKLRLRAGETDQAVTVSQTAFMNVAEEVGNWTQHRGLIDVDVIVDDGGQAHVIDINPRFGGGYPFSHLADADAPAHFVAQIVGRVDDDHLSYRPGVIASKYEGIVSSEVSK